MVRVNAVTMHSSKLQPWFRVRVQMLHVEGGSVTEWERVGRTVYEGPSAARAYAVKGQWIEHVTHRQSRELARQSQPPGGIV